MKNRDDSMEWIPLWIDKWIFGSTRIELQPDERSVWVDLMAVASKDNGYIRANPDTEYPPQQLAGLLCISEELLNRTLQRCLETKKIAKSENGAGYYILNWATYQLSDRHRRRFFSNVAEKEHMSLKTDTMSPEADAIGEERRGEDRKGKDRISREGKPFFISPLEKKKKEQEEIEKKIQEYKLKEPK